MKNSFVFFAYIFLFCSCGHKSSTPLPESKEALYVISLEEAIEDKEFSFEKFNGSFRYVQLETTSESLITDIRFLGLLNDTIVVVDDARQIMSFTSSGKYIGRIGKEGGGPLEYYGIKSFSLDRKSGHAIVVDYQRVLRYDLKGNLIASYNPNNLTDLIATYNLRSESMSTYEDNSLFSNNYIFNFYRASIRNPYAHSYYGIDDSLKSNFINPNPMYKCIASGWSVNPLTQLDDTIAFVKPLSDTIFQFVNGGIAPRFVLQHKEPLLSQSKIDFYNNSEKELNYMDYLAEQRKNGYFVGIQDIFETKDFLLFNLNYQVNYIFDKSNRLLYKVTGYKDIGSEDVLTIGKNSNCNSLIAAMIPSNVMTTQDFFLRMKKEKKEKEKFKNLSPEYERLILDFEEENNPIVIIATFE